MLVSGYNLRRVLCCPSSACCRFTTADPHKQHLLSHHPSAVRLCELRGSPFPFPCKFCLRCHMLSCICHIQYFLLQKYAELVNCFPGGDRESKSRCRKKHLIGKRKKKKRRKDDENSSDTDSAFVLKHTKLKRQEELPDIIPKQVKTKYFHCGPNT